MNARTKIAAEIAEMIEHGNDPNVNDLLVEPTTDDYYNAGRIAGLRLALAAIDADASPRWPDLTPNEEAARRKTS